LFKDVKYAFGEFGGFTLYMDDKRFYPIMVGEKQICWLKLTMKGPAGHASRPIRGAAMGKMAKIVQTLDQKRLPVHVTPPVRMMIESISMEMPIAKRTLLNQLLNPRLTDRILDLLGDQGKLFDYLLHNTASPTMIHASDKINVIPAEVTLEVDARLLPGLTTADILRELRALVGGEVGIEIMMNDQGPSAPNMGLFDTLAGILKEADPGAIPIPYVVPAVTDARFFAQLGIQTYGFLPMKLPQGFDFSSTVHAADERVPAEAVEFGANAVYQGLLKFI
jgi:acetylornithine deacetylase/succinyl-diaminopimelate desuccinylase-like protein